MARRILTGVDLNGQRAQHIGAPTATDDAATKAYVDSAVGAGLRKYAASVGDGTATTFTLTHALGSADVVAVVYDATGVRVECDLQVTATQIILTFVSAPAANAYRVVAVG